MSNNLKKIENKNKKVVYMGRSEVWGGETCFSLKNMASASLAYSTFATQLLIKQGNWKNKTRKKIFFEKFLIFENL